MQHEEGAEAMRRVAIAAAKTVAVLAAIAGLLYAESRWLDFTDGHPVRAVIPFVACIVGAAFYGFYRATKNPPEDRK
jgi:hypothetical protein